jgi:hypothetical protein
MTPTMDTTAVMALPPRDREALVAAVRAPHARDSTLCQRRESREQAVNDRQGVRLERPRRSNAPLVLALEGATSPAACRPAHAGV